MNFLSHLSSTVTEPVDAAVALALSDNYALLDFPPGVFLIKERHIRDGQLAIRGAGRGITTLIVEGDAGFTNTGEPDYQGGGAVLELADLTILVRGENPDAVIKQSLTGGSGSSSRTVSMSNVAIRSENGEGQFHCGVELHNSRGALLDNVTIQGNSVGLRETFASIFVHGESDPIEAHITNTQITHTKNAIVIGGAVEGTRISRANIFAADTGITGHSEQRKPVVNVTDSHIATSIRGIQLTNFSNPVIMNNEIWGDFDGWIGIDFYFTMDVGFHTAQVIANRLRNSGGAGPRTGIKMHSSVGFSGRHNTIISDNDILGMTTYAIELGPSINGVSGRGNRAENLPVAQRFVNNGDPDNFVEFDH